MRLSDVTSPDPASQTEVGLIGAPCDLLDIVKRHYGCHGAEDLLPGDAHIIAHVSEDGRGMK